MNMIVLFLNLLSLLLAPIQKDTVHLKGNLKEIGTGKITMRYNGAAALLGNSRDLVLKTDREGYFDTTFLLNEPAYYSINRNTLYLSPGDDLELEIFQGNEKAVITGKGAAANLYLRDRLFPKNGSFLIGGALMREDFAKTKAYIDSMATVRTQRLDTLQNVTSLFKELERGRIIGDVLNSYISYYDYAPGFQPLDPAARNEKMKVCVREMAPDFISRLTAVNKDHFLDIAVLRDVFMYLFDPAYFPVLEQIKPNAKRNELYNSYAQVLLLQNTPSLKKVGEIQDYAQKMKYPEFRTELNLKTARALKLLPGQPAIDIRLNTTDNTVKNLSDFRGKFLYIDLWATWCGPCKEETPFFEALSSKYSPDDILFIQVSTDKQMKAWKNYLNTKDSKLIQVHSDDLRLTEGWEVFSIPRFLLIDRDFKIIDAYAPRPSSDQIESLLNGCISK